MLNLQEFPSDVMKRVSHAEMSVTQPSKTLIYPGCGYDKELIGLNLPYDRVIAYDTLPAIHHYKPGQNGWTHTAKPALFFAKLKDEYGEFEEISDTELHFPMHNITYHHSTNCHHVEIPEGDIFVRGYLCESWLPAMQQRRVIASCDTFLGDLYDNNVDFEIVHTCGDGPCSLEDDAFSSDGEDIAPR